MPQPGAPRVLCAVQRSTGLAIRTLVFAALVFVATASANPPVEDDCEHFLQRLCCGDENLILVSGCSPKQNVPLRLGGGDHEVFVDGERLEGVPDDLRLRADRDHTVFIKRPGYRPELIVLRSEGDAGSPELVPSTIELELAKRMAVASRTVAIEEVDPEAAPTNAEAVEVTPPGIADGKAGEPSEPPANQSEPPAKRASAEDERLDVP